MRTTIISVLLTAGLAACAVEPGSPSVKVAHGDGPFPAFDELNYAVDFGRRCSPSDAKGRHYSSFVWLRANRTDGSYDPLRAGPEHCGSAAIVQAE